MTFPFFGACPDEHGIHFRVMAATAAGAPRRSVQLVIHSGRAAGTYELTPAETAVWTTVVRAASPGDRYSYRVDGGELRPDPASRFQPDGVHGPSEIVDPRRYPWRDAGWKGRAARELVVYELHVGTFTAEGTFDAARQRLPELRALGVTAIELMPVADFPGSRNWGYDGVALYAPARAYGQPDDLRAFVDDAHALGLGVLLDVVHNHLGPEGAYLPQFNPQYITYRHSTPWGGAINLDDRGSELVRHFIIDSALHWIREYRLDGLRFDATHALIDDSPTHLLAELAEHARRAAARPLALHAEDHRNLATIVMPREEGGWGLDGIWVDDYHHSVRRLVAGDVHGYYEDYEGTTEELARTIRQGWLYTGQPSRHLSRCRGTDASCVPMRRSIVCLQNHDQVGNRAGGDRLHHRVAPETWRAATVLLLTGPMTPLLFMGQEWAASSPFLYFTDLEPGLGEAVSQGRRREFGHFPGFDPALDVPDPQAESTFDQSKLRWEERTSHPHAGSLALHAQLLALRRAHPPLQASDSPSGEAWAVGNDAIVMRRAGDLETFVVVVLFRGEGVVEYGRHVAVRGEPEILLTTEEAAFAPDAQPPEISRSSVRFERPGAVVLRL